MSSDIRVKLAEIDSCIGFARAGVRAAKRIDSDFKEHIDDVYCDLLNSIKKLKEIENEFNMSKT